jgi:hypothetical protein
MTPQSMISRSVSAYSYSMPIAPWTATRADTATKSTAKPQAPKP